MICKENLYNKTKKFKNDFVNSPPLRATTCVRLYLNMMTFIARKSVASSWG